MAAGNRAAASAVPTQVEIRHRRVARLVAAVVLTTVVLAGCHHDAGPPPAGSTTIRSGGVAVHAIVRGPSPPKAIATVLFLHGQAYTSKIWADRGILDAVAAKGFRAVAVDLPGHGDTPARTTADTQGSSGSVTSDGTWLRGLVDTLGGPSQVIVVSPSMSGRYSLAMLQQYPEVILEGFVPVAPAGIDTFDRPTDAAPQPTLSVWGSKDPTYTPARAKHLVSELGGAPDARTEVIDGASHAAYDDHPEEFLALLLPFLGQVTS